VILKNFTSRSNFYHEIKRILIVNDNCWNLIDQGSQTRSWPTGRMQPMKALFAARDTV